MVIVGNVVPHRPQVIVGNVVWVMLINGLWQRRVFRVSWKKTLHEKRENTGKE